MDLLNFIVLHMLLRVFQFNTLYTFIFNINFMFNLKFVINSNGRQ